MKKLLEHFKETGELNDQIGALRTLIWNLNRDINVTKNEDIARVGYAEIKALLKAINIKVGELDRKLEDD
jgi:hypothetical protein